MTEERSVPDLATIVDDLKGMSERLDQGLKNAGDDFAKQLGVLKSFVQNDLMSVIQDFAESSLIGFQDLQDAVEPVEIPQYIAETTATMLQAYKAQNMGNPELVGRIDECLEFLADEDDGDEEEG